jgi:hypothetical protein
MRLYGVRSGIALAVALCLLCGCLPTVIRTEQEYVLIRAQDERFVIVEDDDPFYERVNSEILADPYVHSLLTIYEDATEAFLATNKLTLLSQSLANKPIIVVGSPESGAVHKLRAHYGEAEVRIELALGLAHGADDLQAAQREVPSAAAEVFIQLVGLKPEQGQAGAPAPTAQDVTTETQAFCRGFALALETLYSEAHPEWLRALQAESEASSEAQVRRTHLELLPRNGFRFRFEAGQPTEALRPPSEMWRTPGVAGTFFYRLLKSTSDFYPQRHMLWMTNFEGEVAPYAKVLLAMNRMPHKRDVSMQAFIASYIETFPAEREAILALASEVFGSEAAAAVAR